MVKPGVPVMTARGQAAKLGGIIVDPTSLRVTGIILYQSWWTGSRVVSIQHVAELCGTQVRLNCTPSDLLFMCDGVRVIQILFPLDNLCYTDLKLARSLETGGMKMTRKTVLLTIESLAELTSVHQPPCLSLYKPTHRRHPENQQNPIRFRNLVKELETALQIG